MTSTFKRLREESFFSGAFVVFRHISAIFRVFCLVVFGFFVYLHTVKGATICTSDLANDNFNGGFLSIYVFENFTNDRTFGY